MTKFWWSRHIIPHPAEALGTRNVCNECKQHTRTIRWRFNGKSSFIWLCPPCSKIVERRCYRFLLAIGLAAILIGMMVQ